MSDPSGGGESRMDRWWWGVLCGAAGSLITTVLFLIFMVAVGLIHFNAPQESGAGDASPLGVRKPVAVQGPALFTLRGSTTIGDDLAPLMVRAFLVSQGFKDVVVGRRADSTKDFDQVVQGRGPDGADHYVEIVSEGSKTAPPALLDGTADVGMMSTQMKDEQAVTLQAKFGGDPRMPGCEYVIGLDGVAVIVNPSNSLASISIDKLADAFTTASDWSSIGRSSGGPIKIERRDDNSGTTDVFKALVLGARPMAHGQQLADNKAVAVAVASSPDAIGYVGAGFITKSVKALDVSAGNGAKAISPLPVWIKLETYPISRRLYLYIAPAGRKPMVDAFARFVASSQIDTLVEQAGEVPLNIQLIEAGSAGQMAQSLAQSAPSGSAYADAIVHADRLSVDFRFRSGSDDLDTRAVADLARLKAYLPAAGKTGSELKLIGFSDGTGDDALSASKADADRVAAALRAMGVDVPPGRVMGAGVVKIAPGDSADARRRNRRVEVWIGG